MSCCTSIAVPGGTFNMGRSTVSGSPDYYSSGSQIEVPEHPATVAAFALDKFEVTVGRFRKFVEYYDGTPPAEGAGANPNVGGSGWQSAWNGHLPASQAALIWLLNWANHTWTDVLGANENYAMNCVS